MEIINYKALALLHSGTIFNSMKTVITKNWLTRNKNPHSLPSLSLLFLLLYASAVLYFTNYFSSQEWMPATSEGVFQRHEYWRLFTALFAHSDMGHLLSNSLIFFPFSYFLMNYFSLWLFPISGLMLGALVNYLVLKTMPEHSSLIGISGVVYWLGATWITLFMLIDHREKWRRKAGHVLFLFLMIFIPDTIKPDISYLSHFLGFIFGVASGILYYQWNKKKIQKAEVISFIDEPVEHDEWRIEYESPEEIAKKIKREA